MGDACSSRRILVESRNHWGDLGMRNPVEVDLKDVRFNTIVCVK